MQEMQWYELLSDVADKILAQLFDHASLGHESDNSYHIENCADKKQKAEL